MIAPALGLYVTVAMAVTALHDHCLRSEGEQRPVASAVVGLMWPLIVVLLVLVVIAGLVWDLIGHSEAP